MPEEILFKSESTHERASIADYLRAVADTLEAGDALTLTAGGESTTLEIPSHPTFEVKAEREFDHGGTTTERSVEFEIEWDEDSDNGGAGGSLSIE